MNGRKTCHLPDFIHQKKKRRQMPEFEEPKAVSSPINSDEEDDVTPRHRHYDSGGDKEM